MSNYTYTIEAPPTDAELKKVIVHYMTINKPHNILSLKKAAELGLIYYETDSRGYVISMTSLEGRPGFPGDVAKVRPFGDNWKHVDESAVP